MRNWNIRKGRTKGGLDVPTSCTNLLSFSIFYYLSLVSLSKREKMRRSQFFFSKHEEVSIEPVKHVK